MSHLVFGVGMFGVGMFGVAAFAARPWDDSLPYVESEDVLHSVAAGVVGFGFIVGVVVVMVSRRLPSVRAAVPDLVALAVAVVVSLMMWTGVWGPYRPPIPDGLALQFVGYRSLA